MCRVLGVAARRVRAVQATPAHLPHTGSTVSKLDVTMKATPGLYWFMYSTEYKPKQIVFSSSMYMYMQRL